MIREAMSRRLTERLESAYRHWDDRRIATRTTASSSSGAPHAFCIAISREAGALGTAVGQEVGRRLSWQVYDHQLLDMVAQDMGVRTKLLESIDEKQNSWLLEVFEKAFAVPMVSEPAYVFHLARVVLALGAHGECVIVGRGAAQILPAATTLRVRLVAPVKERIEVICREHGKTAEEARHFLQASDREHAAFIRNHFQKDPLEPHQYDAILNTARLSVAQCAGLIVQGLHDLQTNAAGIPSLAGTRSR